MDRLSDSDMVPKGNQKIPKATKVTVVAFMSRCVSTEMTGSILTCRHDFSPEWRTYYDHRYTSLCDFADQEHYKLSACDSTAQAQLHH